jgi:purine nucleosidase/pyrimidine-specific ribonucleoside hydrolase
VTPVIIDTDIGDDVDDALAIAFALLRPELDVRGITTVYGPTQRRLAILSALVATLAQATGRKTALLPLLAAGEAVPLTPLPQERVDKLVQSVPNQYPFAGEGSPPGPTHPRNALDVFEKVISENPRDVVLVTIGAMTNAAQFIQRRPDLARELRGISIMGGSYLPGFAEYNIQCDPVAAKAVFQSNIPRAQFTWEVSGKVLMREPEMAALRAAKGPIPRALCRLIDLWWPHKGRKPGPVIYDMSPILWLFRPDIFDTEPRGVDVITNPGPDFAHTVPTSGPVVSVATDMDADAAMRLFLDTVRY